MPQQKHAALEASLADWPAVRAFALQFTRDGAAAEDLAQDAYLRLWSLERPVDTTRSLRPLLLTMVRHLAVEKTRRIGTLPLDPEADFPDDAPSALDRLEANDDASRLKSALAALPRTWSAALFLADGLDCPADEIAAILGTTAEVVRVTLHRARRRLRERLASIFSEPSHDDR